MILSVLRMADDLEFPPMLYCHDQDFRAAMIISKVLMRHTVRVYKELSSHELYKPAAEGTKRQNQLLDELPAEFGTAEAIETAAKMGISQKSVERYLKEWREAELTQRVSHGHYRKTYPQTDKPSQPSAEGIPSDVKPQPNDTQYETTTEEDPD